MAGKLFFISKRVVSNNSVSYTDYDDRDGWIFTSRQCEDIAFNIKNRGENVTHSCEEMCFCKLYRAKLIDAIMQFKIKRAWKIFYFGLLRMLKDRKESKALKKLEVRDNGL
jgi:hypothetical protein